MGGNVAKAESRLLCEGTRCHLLPHLTEELSFSKSRFIYPPVVDLTEKKGRNNKLGLSFMSVWKIVSSELYIINVLMLMVNVCHVKGLSHGEKYTRFLPTVIVQSNFDFSTAGFTGFLITLLWCYFFHFVQSLYKAMCAANRHKDKLSY